MRPKVLLLTLALVMALASGCYMPPKTFVKTMEPGFKEIRLRKDVDYERGWDSVVDAIARKFDIEVLDKRDGYLRTGWAYYTTGKLLEDYRVRITIKFNSDRDQLTLKTEAQHRRARGWVLGYDIAVLTDTYNDIQGKIGHIIK